MQPFLRSTVLRAAGMPQVAGWFRTSQLAGSMVDLFVAGETIDDALVEAARLMRGGMTATLDLLGENVQTEGEARQAVEGYRIALRRLAAAGLEPNISVKLTMLGLDLGDALALETTGVIVEAAHAIGGFVRIDMESSAYTERTLAIAGLLHERFPDNVGTVIQAALRRSPADVEWAIARGMRIRLVKGAYAEPAAVALGSGGAVDEAYVRLMERLLDIGNYPALATHDPALIRAAQGYTARMAISPDRYEFQMLYGVRRQAQRDLVRDGYRMRVYVPYGSQWYPYFTRRIAERPANALFVLRQIFD
ncbi:MAG: proline dehydrogenase family protein [Thermomicrobiales bacterium]|nr:proline dehydrogenase family protein [Thermomicrobiales bacterium]